jgi:4-amino-4-deoxy-L-arabinose transferase-like glycosyltransferase
MAGRRTLGTLLLAALCLFTARMGDLSLPSLEDAFYAREAVEMARAGRAYTVTWNGVPTHQHPPLQLWIVARAFRGLGEHDVAARLPTVILALGTLLVTYRIGSLTVGTPAAVAGVAALLATPMFVDNARRLMMEVPLAFWVASAIWLYLEAAERGRPAWHVLLAVPLGGALLTKSVLGLMPLLALPGALARREWRVPLARPWVWIGLVLGLAIGASWPVHQWLTQDPEAVRSHFVAHVLRRSAGRQDLLALLEGYPRFLVKFYQPVVFPALAGAWLLLRRPGPLRARGAVLVAWIVVPVVLYSVSAFRTPRFIFPILPALALSAGHALVTLVPRAAAIFSGWVVPLGALAVAAVLWLNPSLLTRDRNAPFKRGAATIRAAVPEGESLPYLGNHYWATATPLLYYAERHLAPSSGTGAQAVADAARHRARMLLVTRARLPEVLGQGVGHRIVLEGRDWVLLRLEDGHPPPA